MSDQGALDHERKDYIELPQRLMTPFGKNVREVREILGLSGAELSRRAGLTPATISQVELGHREPTLGTIVRILSVLPVKFERLVGWE